VSPWFIPQVSDAVARVICADMAAHDATTAERVARNDALLRDSNEKIDDVAKLLEGYEEGLLPFLCECADVGCTEILQLTGAEYEAVRQHPTRFINVPGHHVAAQGWARVVEERGRYSIVEKIGEAADVVRELDPRSAGAP
jgi:hypothetical protein